MYINDESERRTLRKLNEFVVYIILDCRTISDTDDIILKFVIDGGSNSLKICLSIQMILAAVGFAVKSSIFTCLF